MADLSQNIETFISEVKQAALLVSKLDVNGNANEQIALLDQIISKANLIDLIQTGVTIDMNVSLKPIVNVSDAFQGIRFYDGTRFGYLRINPTKVELLVGEPLEYKGTQDVPFNGAISHSYRISAKGNDVKLYVDNVLAIDGTGKFTQKTDHRLIEFGDISGRSQTYGSAWKNFRYNVDGNTPPGGDTNMVTEEILSVPGGAFGSASAYSNAIYASFDPDDDASSSSIYRYKEGYTPEIVPTRPITKSSVNAVKIDPNKQTEDRKSVV